jgi:hypothetical protein
MAGLTFKALLGDRLYGAAGAQVKGRGSLAALPAALKVHRLHPGGAAFPYPQKLWTTLWTSLRKGARFRGQIAFLLPWSINEQAFLPCFFNGLRASYSAAWPL